jgi:hypothetical protein
MHVAFRERLLAVYPLKQAIPPRRPVVLGPRILDVNHIVSTNKNRGGICAWFAICISSDTLPASLAPNEQGPGSQQYVSVIICKGGFAAEYLHFLP